MTETLRKIREAISEGLHGSNDKRESLCAAILVAQGYKHIEPQAPRGGSDGGKDILFSTKTGKALAGIGFQNDADKNITRNRSKAVSKAKEDIDSAVSTRIIIEEFIFFTNVELTPENRESIKKYCKTKMPGDCVVYDKNSIVSHIVEGNLHLAKIYLGIDLTKDELNEAIRSLQEKYEEAEKRNKENYSTLKASVLLQTASSTITVLCKFEKTKQTKPAMGTISIAPRIKNSRRIVIQAEYFVSNISNKDITGIAYYDEDQDPNISYLNEEDESQYSPNRDEEKIIIKRIGKENKKMLIIDRPNNEIWVALSSTLNHETATWFSQNNKYEVKDFDDAIITICGNKEFMKKLMGVEIFFGEILIFSRQSTGVYRETKADYSNSFDTLEKNSFNPKYKMLPSEETEEFFISFYKEMPKETTSREIIEYIARIPTISKVTAFENSIFARGGQMPVLFEKDLKWPKREAKD